VAAPPPRRASRAAVSTRAAGLFASAAAFDLALAHGTILVDIDDWLEALFSARLEDSWIRHIVFFRWSR